MRVGSCSISSSIPVPSFEDILNISSSLDPIKLCICLETLSISTSTESILRRGSCQIPDCTCKQFLDAFEEIDDEQL